MEIKLDSEAFAGIASAAIFESLSQESRDTVIKQALTYLMTPPTTRNYGVTPETPLQQAFNNAIRQVATKAVREKIEDDPEINEAIYDLLGPIIKPALETTAADYDHSLAEALGGALSNWLTDKARERRND